MPAGPFGVDEYQHAGYAEGLQDAERKRPTVIVMVGGAPLSADIASNMEPMDMQQML